MSKRKLLLADDSVTIQKVVNLTFADEGIEVISVSDGDAAMTRILEVSPDIVMLDVNMPGLTGYQICENLRKSEQFKHLPVVLLVGSFEPFDEDESRRVGANEYLTKPFQSIRQLVTTITNLLGSAEIKDNPVHDEAIEEIKSPVNSHVPIAVPTVFPATNIFSRNTEVEATTPNEIPFTEKIAEPKFESYDVIDSAPVEENVSDSYQESSVSDSVYEPKEHFSYEEKVESPVSSYDSVEHVAETESVYVPKEHDSYEIDEVKTIPSYAAVDSSWDDKIEVSHDIETSESDEVSVESPNSVVESTEETVDEKTETEAITEEFTDTSNDEDFDSVSHSGSEISKEPESVEIDETAETPQTLSEPAVESFPFPEAASILELDENNLLEIAPREEDFLVNMDDNDFDSEIEFDDLAFGENAFDHAPQSFVAPVNEKEMKYEIDEATINEIVNRVIAKLSDSVVREVAWEVVPTKADAIIKQLAEEKLENS